jgi:hypothetical protein
LTLLGGCGASARPAVMPMMSELPADPEKRDAVLDSASAQPGPEQRKPLPPKLHRVETTAATAAAILGELFSTTQNMTFGAASPFDEGLLVAPPPPPPSTRPTDGTNDESLGAHPDPSVPATDLVPWVRLKEPTPE